MPNESSASAIVAKTEAPLSTKLETSTIPTMGAVHVQAKNLESEQVGTNGRTFGVDTHVESSKEEYFERKEGQWLDKTWTSKFTNKYLEGIRREFIFPRELFCQFPKRTKGRVTPFLIKLLLTKQF